VSDTGSNAQLFTRRPGFIRATLMVVCAQCQGAETLPYDNILKAGLVARRRGWAQRPACGGWICNGCDERRFDEQLRQVRANREVEA
jgi:hypothetical protein